MYLERWSHTLIARFMGPTWGPSGADRTQVGPMLAPWTLLSGILRWSSAIFHQDVNIYLWSTLQCKLPVLCDPGRSISTTASSSTRLVKHKQHYGPWLPHSKSKAIKEVKVNERSSQGQVTHFHSQSAQLGPISSLGGVTILFFISSKISNINTKLMEIYFSFE